MHPRLSYLLRGFVLAGGVFTLTACTTLGPDFLEPKVNWVDDWKPSWDKSVKPDVEQTQLDMSFWWQLFNDPILNQLIETAKQENLSLRIAGLRIFESQALLGIAGSSLYPQLQQASGAINYVNTKGHNGALPASRASSVAYQAGLNMAWELDFWGRFHRGIESADAAYFASIANQQDAQLLLTAQVADLYFSYRITQARIKIADHNAEIQKRSYEITERLFKGGEDSELDLQQAKSQYLATLSSIPDLELTLLRARNALGALLGRAPGDLPELTDEAYKLPVIDARNLDAVPAELLMRRPDIRSSALAVATQSAQIGIAEADFYPSISLVGSVGWSGSSLTGNPYTDALGVGPALRWNIFDYGRIKNNVRIQDVRLQQLIESYQNSVLTAAREVDDAGYGVIKTAEQDVLITASYQAADRALELANSRYREGYSDFQRVLDAQRALFNQEERQLLNQGAHISAVIALYKSLGGGWIAMSEDQLIPDDIRDTMKTRSNWGEMLDPPPAEEAVKQ